MESSLLTIHLPPRVSMHTQRGQQPWQSCQFKLGQAARSQDFQNPGAEPKRTTCKVIGSGSITVSKSCLSPAAGLRPTGIVYSLDSFWKPPETNQQELGLNPRGSQPTKDRGNPTTASRNKGWGVSNIIIGVLVTDRRLISTDTTEMANASVIKKQDNRSRVVYIAPG